MEGWEVCISMFLISMLLTSFLSLRTDIPIKALNLHFNVNFSIVSQVNPHVNLFFFSSRGSVGRPVLQHGGRGWRGGFLGSAIIMYLSLELEKFLKISKHLELVPRPLGQDWSQIWLQQFSGTITIWPKTQLSDFAHILSDPSPERLAHMLLVGQQCTFPKLLFIENRMKIERLIEKGMWLEGSDKTYMHVHHRAIIPPAELSATDEGHGDGEKLPYPLPRKRRRPSFIQEIKRQSGVFFDDSEIDGEETGGSEDETAPVTEDAYNESQ